MFSIWEGGMSCVGKGKDDDISRGKKKGVRCRVREKEKNIISSHQTTTEKGKFHAQRTLHQKKKGLSDCTCKKGDNGAQMETN